MRNANWHFIAETGALAPIFDYWSDKTPSYGLKYLTPSISLDPAPEVQTKETLNNSSLSFRT